VTWNEPTLARCRRTGGTFISQQPGEPAFWYYFLTPADQEPRGPFNNPHEADVDRIDLEQRD